jgi:hypothetical protein
MKNQCLQDEGVDCSSGCMRAFMWDFEGFQSSQTSQSLGTLMQPVRIHFISKLVIERGLELMASALSSTFGDKGTQPPDNTTLNMIFSL